MSTPAQQELPSPAVVRLIGIALMVGAISFAAVAVGMAFLSPPEEAAAESDASLIKMLSLVHGAYFPIAAFMSSLALKKALTSPPERFVATLIVRWALVEGAAMFGSVIVLLAGMFGVLPGSPIYYLNLAPTAILAAVILSDLAHLGLLGGALRDAS